MPKGSYLISEICSLPTLIRSEGFASVHASEFFEHFSFKERLKLNREIIVKDTYETILTRLYTLNAARPVRAVIAEHSTLDFHHGDRI